MSIGENKKSILLKKQKHINDLLKIYNANAIELDNFWKRIESTHMTDEISYFAKMKLVKAYVKKENTQNALNARISHAQINYKLAELSSLLLEPYRLNTAQLNEFVNWFSGWFNNTRMPYMPHQINNINRANKKSRILDIKAKYLKYVKIPPLKNSTKSKIFKLQLSYLEHKIQYLNLKISDIKSSFYNRYFAKRVKTLEKKKKEISNIKNDSVINLVNVSKYYYNRSIATKVLNDVNLQIKPGEFVVIVGPSGSGKTTLLNIISGMDKATYGHVNIAGENLINFNNAKLTSFRRRNVGYVFQQYALLSNLTVKENVEIGQHLQSDKTRRIDIDHLLKLLDIYEQRNKFPHELSGGQQQRVSIARSVAKNPIILFGDEPTGAVDEATSRNILDMFTKINKEWKTTVIIVTHNQELTKLATTVIQVKDGNATKVKG